MSNADQDIISMATINRLGRDGNVGERTGRPEEKMKRIIKIVNDLLNIAESSDNLPPPPPLKDCKAEMQLFQFQIESEKEKGKLKDEMIKDLRADKLRLQLAHMEKAPPLMKKKEEMVEKVQPLKPDKKFEEDTNCPLPPMDNHPECMGKLKWLSQMWKSQPCYAGYGVNGSVCSFLIYLSEVEKWCPVLSCRVPLSKKAEAGSDYAVVREHLTDLYPSLEKRSQFRWIEQRICSMERVWVEAGRSLSAKYNLKERKAKQILVHPGVVTDESNARIAEAAFNGGPLGELVQWSDLLSTLHILGHHVYLTASLPDLRHYFGVDTGGCPPLHSNPDLIYTDIIGLRQIKSVLKGPWFKYRCIIRVLDTFGTEPDFNHISWANKHKLESPFGGLNMIPLQFYTMFPHTPDNTFLGFVVQNQLMSEQSELFKSNKRQNQALVYGKRAEFWEGKTAYLDVIHKYLEIHGTVNRNALPNYVKNHGIVKGTDVQALLRQSKVFVGLSFPYEGPAPLEALANGCAFLNPKLNPPQSSLNTKFFKGKPNIREIISQHPYAEAIGEPYVWTVDMKNLTEVERALNAILNQTIEPYLPYEFSCEGMLQRVNVLIEKQDLCSSAVSWPPLSALQVVKAQMSCKTACQKAGLICEPAFFPHLNNANTLAKNNVDCQTSEFSASGLVFPAYNSTQHCWFQSDPLLFSCVRSDESLTRVCPCRDFIKDQIALCKDCI
ncbi:hypothetical protein CesoFtcFv8_014194 [Champsocephalus esox]|uniref:alpha-1,6-mannosyl-glycoprotein 6-beta-N-acetylglucosaminyltransferase n=1 Tax=Champsocephalus esox TaxID=159716 RepID=A0AAN8BV22_9TELE|nr:hypothetical protein CesoFtcFv8_014194 [Champsocephalus esox]